MIGRNQEQSDAGRKTRSGPGSEAAQSIIASDLELRGSIREAGKLRVEGFVQGGIDCAFEVVIGPSGRVQGDISATRITVAGSVDGDLVASDELVLRKTAEVVGDGRAGALVVEAGASIDGRVSIGEFFAGPETVAGNSAAPASATGAGTES